MRLSRGATALLLGTALSCAAPAHAQQSGIEAEIDLFADLRLGIADGEPSWLDNNWLGKGRFGGELNGDTDTDLAIAEIALLADIDFSWEWSAFVHAKYDEVQDNDLDLVEAYVTYSPAPTSRTRYSFRAGLFFPHISRENVGIAWTSPYTITPSAVNSWIGEEIRALGLEGKVSFRGQAHQLDVTAAIFGYNDAAGTLLAFRGWALGDVKAGAFTRLPLPRLPQIGLGNELFVQQPRWVEPVAEIDERPGFYGALDYTYNRNWKAGAFYYDNRADASAIESLQYGWDTRFWNFYVEGDAFAGIHLIAQYMTGNTKMGSVVPATGTRYLDVDFDAGFVLATRKFGDQRLSARWDWFDTTDLAFVQRDNNNEAGAAFTAAYAFDFSKRGTVMAEYLYIDSKRPARQRVGFAPNQTQSIFQLALRYRF